MVCKIFTGLLAAHLLLNPLAAVVSNASETEMLSGEIRLRSEVRDNADFNSANSDKTSFNGFRLRLGLNKKVSDSMNFFVQIQDTRIWGLDSVLTDKGESVDIHQGYVDLSEGSCSLRVGRQQLSYGSQRLIGGFWWHNNARAFDGIKLNHSAGSLSTDLFLTKIKETSISATGAATGAGNDDTDFYGIYSTLKRTDTKQVAFYILQKNDYSIADLALTTLGTRIAEKNKMNFDYTGEVAFQSGSMAKSDISAYALALTLGYSLKTRMPVRLGVEYDRGSGDDNAGDDKIKTFDNLFPTNHLWYGSMDYQGWKNMESIRLTGSVKPVKNHMFVLNYHIFKLLETADSWYGANGKARGGFGVPAGESGSKNLGSEIDIIYRIVKNKNLKVEAGYSHYFKGDYIKDSVTKNTDSDWGYLQLVAGF